jgi:hypothetical protein
MGEPSRLRTGEVGLRYFWLIRKLEPTDKLMNFHAFKISNANKHNTRVE